MKKKRKKKEKNKEKEIRIGSTNFAAGRKLRLSQKRAFSHLEKLLPYLIPSGSLNEEFLAREMWAASPYSEMTSRIQPMAPRKGPAPKTMQSVMKRKKREEEEGEEEKEEWEEFLDC